MDIGFQPTLAASEVVTAVDRLESSIRQKSPFVKRIFIEAESFKNIDLKKQSVDTEHSS